MSTCCKLSRTVWSSWSIAVWVDTEPLMNTRNPSSSPAMRIMSSTYQIVILTLTLRCFTPARLRLQAPGWSSQPPSPCG